MSIACKNIPQQWISFTANIDPLDILVPIELDSSTKNSNFNNVYSGLVFNNTDSLSLYSSFLSSKTNDNHIGMINADGFLKYNSKRKEYQLSNSEKLIEYTLPGITPPLT